MRIYTVIALQLLACSLTAADKPNLSGTWRLQQDAQVVEGVLPAIKILHKDAELQVSDASGKAGDSGMITCNTKGKECEAKLGGHPVKVSYWFNGIVHKTQSSARLLCS